MAKPFVPKQSIPFAPKLFGELMGDVTLQIARKIVTMTPLAPGAVVHDNGCGTGIVTQAITEIRTPGSLSINATDNLPPLIPATVALAASKGWSESVKAEVMNSEELSFKDATFSDSLTNFVLMLLQKPGEAAKEIYRTLQPGGVAIVTTWAEIPAEAAILKAHEETRGGDAEHQFKGRRQWADAEYLTSVMKEAGFKDVEIVQSDCVLTIPDLKRWSLVAWSLLGSPGAQFRGWVEKDEEVFEKALEAVYESMKANKNVELDGEGGAKCKQVAHIVIAKK